MSGGAVITGEPVAVREHPAAETVEGAELRAKTPAQRMRQLELLLSSVDAPDPPPAVNRTATPGPRWTRLRAPQPAPASPLRRSGMLRDWPSPIYDIWDTPLRSALDSVRLLLRTFDDRGLVLGGVAASILGRPRLTRDIDVALLLPPSDLQILLLAAGAVGIAPRIDEAAAFARESGVVLMRHERTGIDVDISLAAHPFEAEAIARATIVDLDGVMVRLPAPEDLVVFKAVEHRDQDLQDIRAIIRANPGLDAARIRFWVRAFAEELDAPELWDDIAGWL
jgi:hypothetical protein